MKHHITHILKTAKHGYDTYGWLLWLPTLSAILVKLLGIDTLLGSLASGTIDIIGFAFFYAIGHADKRWNKT